MTRPRIELRAVGEHCKSLANGPVYVNKENFFFSDLTWLIWTNLKQFRVLGSSCWSGSLNSMWSFERVLIIFWCIFYIHIDFWVSYFHLHHVVPLARISLATSPYRSSLLAGLQGYISNPHRAAVCMFEPAVLHLFGHMRGSIGVHHLWARPCFSSSVLRVWSV